MKDGIRHRDPGYPPWMEDPVLSQGIREQDGLCSQRCRTKPDKLSGFQQQHHLQKGTKLTSQHRLKIDGNDMCFSMKSTTHQNNDAIFSPYLVNSISMPTKALENDLFGTWVERTNNHPEWI